MRCTRAIDKLFYIKDKLEYLKGKYPASYLKNKCLYFADKLAYIRREYANCFSGRELLILSLIIDSLRDFQMKDAILLLKSMLKEVKPC